MVFSRNYVFFHLERNIKATYFNFSTNVHKKLLYDTIESHFKIHVYESSLWQHSLVKKCFFEYTLKKIIYIIKEIILYFKLLLWLNRQDSHENIELFHGKITALLNAGHQILT